MPFQAASACALYPESHGDVHSSPLLPNVLVYTLGHFTTLHRLSEAQNATHIWLASSFSVFRPTPSNSRTLTTQETNREQGITTLIENWQGLFWAKILHCQIPTQASMRKSTEISPTSAHARHSFQSLEAGLMPGSFCVSPGVTVKTAAPARAKLTRGP